MAIIRPSFLMDVANARRIDPRMSFSRASIATRFDRNGLVKTLPANAPALDHDPLTGEVRGLYFGESRTNQLLYSQDFGNAAWTKGGAGTIATWAGGNSPDGTANAQTLSGSGASTSVSITRAHTKTAAAEQWVGSIHFRKLAALYAHFYIEAGTVSNACRAVLNLATAAIHSTSNFGTFSGGLAAIEDIGLGWYRATLTGLTGSETTIRHRCFLTDSTTGTTWSPAGQLWPVWGAQLELGYSASPYIPTDAAAVTRAAELLTATLANWGVTDCRYGTMTLTGRAPPDNTSARVLMRIDNATGAERVDIIRATSRVLTARSYSASAAVASANTVGTVADSAEYSVAVAWSPGEMAISLNGAAAVAVVNGTDPVGLARLLWQQNDGQIARAAYFPRRISDAGLALLSA